MIEALVRVGETGAMVSLGREQLPSAVRPMVEAFWDYPETVHLLPDERRRRRVLPSYLRSDLRDALRFKLLLGAERDGQIVGAAAWIPPGAYPVSARRQIRQALDLLPALPWGWHALREAQRGQAGNRAHHRGHPPHFYLRAIRWYEQFGFEVAAAYKPTETWPDVWAMWRSPRSR